LHDITHGERYVRARAIRLLARHRDDLPPSTGTLTYYFHQIKSIYAKFALGILNFVDDFALMLSVRIDHSFLLE
jgi:hypothetical protein